MLRYSENHSSVLFSSQKLMKNNHHHPATPQHGEASIKRWNQSRRQGAFKVLMEMPTDMKVSERAMHFLFFSLKNRLPDCFSLTVCVNKIISKAYWYKCESHIQAAKCATAEIESRRFG